MVEQANNHSLVETLQQVWQRRKWIMVMGFLGVFVVVLSLVMALPSLYRSSTTILFSQGDIAETVVTSGSRSELAQRLGVIRQEITSRSHLQQVIEQFDLYPQLRQQVPPEAVISRMRKDISIEQQVSQQNPDGATFSITITYQGWEPRLVAQVANDLAARFEQANEELRTGRAARTAAFLKRELDQVEQRMAEQETRISEFRNENLGGLPEQEATNMAAMERLNADLRLNGDKQIQLMTRLDRVITGSGSGGDAGEDSEALSANASVESLRRELANLRQRYTDNFPGIIRLQKRIEQMESQPRQSADAAEAQPEQRAGDGRYHPLAQTPMAIEQELSRLRQEEDQLRDRMDGVQQRVANTPKVDQRLQRLTSDYETIRAEFLNLQDRYQDARLAESLERQQESQFQVLEAAIPPDFPAAPQGLRLMIMSFVLAVGVAGGAAMMAEQLDTSFHSIRDLRSFTSVPVMASLARIETASDRWSRRTRFFLIGLTFLAIVALLAWLAWEYGDGGKGLVWMMAGRAV